MGTLASKFENPPNPQLDFIKKVINQNCIVIFMREGCPFCKKAKEVFDGLSVPYCSVGLDKRKDGSELKAALGDVTGATTVPRVFINGKFVGGGDDVVKLMKEGKIMKLINECAPGLLRYPCSPDSERDVGGGGGEGFTHKK